MIQNGYETTKSENNWFYVEPSHTCTTVLYVLIKILVIPFIIVFLVMFLKIRYKVSNLQQRLWSAQE